MFKLTPLAAAVLVIVGAQAMADDSVSMQYQSGTANIGDVKQTQASFATTDQLQQGEGNDAAAVQQMTDSQIQQLQIGAFNADYGEQLFEFASQILQQQHGALNTNHASQSLGEGHHATLMQDDTFNELYFEQNGSDNILVADQRGSANTLQLDQSGSGNQSYTWQASDNNLATIKQADSMNVAYVTQGGSANTATVDQSGMNMSATIQQFGAANQASVTQQ